MAKYKLYKLVERHSTMPDLGIATRYAIKSGKYFIGGEYRGPVGVNEWVWRFQQGGFSVELHLDQADLDAAEVVALDLDQQGY